MALSKLLETSHGIILEKAYIKIIEQSGNKDNINIRVAVYKDEIARNEGKEFLSQKIYYFIPTLDENFIKQGYEYLKTLPEYANAVDC